MEVFIWTTIVFAGLLLTLGGLLLLASKYLVDAGPFEINVNDGTRELSVSGGETLLSALYENEIYIPSACGGQATCGFCKVRVCGEKLSSALPTEKPFLSHDELSLGVRLACQVKIKEALNVQIPEYLLDVKEYTGRVSSTVSLTYDIKEIRIKLNGQERIEYGYGQYIQVIIPDPDEGTIMRAYSISSVMSSQNEIELNVREHPKCGDIPAGKGSTYLHNLKEGDEVVFVGPYGEFELDKNPEAALVCVGGGAGMAPMKNLVLSILENIPTKPVWLFFGCRGVDDIFYLDMYNALAKKYDNFKVVYALSDCKETDNWDGEKGFIHFSVEKHLPDDIHEHQAFMCGPPPMISAVTEILLDLNMRESRIFYDKF